MKIAVITVTYNDGYKLKEWKQHYDAYVTHISHHIIVDNHSEQAYLDDVRNLFDGSIILERENNGGSTRAYNTGIEYVLNNTDANYIMLLGNDIKISGRDIEKLANYLQEHPEVGQVAPIMCEANSTVVADFGCTINEDLTLCPYMCGRELDDVMQTENICETVTGGVNMAKCSFYQTVGKQDEKLFMYSDEVDMGLRAKTAGYKTVCISTAVCWHQHINPSGAVYRKPYSAFLMARNKLYLAQKHNQLNTKNHIKKTYFMKALKAYIKGILFNNKALREMAIYTYAGIRCGLKNDMTANKYTQY